MSQVCVILPVLNEAENLAKFLPYLVARYRTIVVDNNSTDDSAKIADRLGAEVVFCQQRGYGSAIQTGVTYLKSKAAQPNVIVVFDADGSSPWEAIEQVIRPIIAKDKDLVIAQRSKLEQGSMPIHARFGNWLQVKMIEFFTGHRYADMGPLRALSMNAYNALDMGDRSWGWNVEMQMKASLRKLRIMECKTTYRRRLFGKSKISGSVVGSIRAATKIMFCVFYYFLKEKTSRNQPYAAHSSRAN